MAAIPNHFQMLSCLNISNINWWGVTNFLHNQKNERNEETYTYTIFTNRIR